MLSNVSIIIPVSEDEDKLQVLLEQLAEFAFGSEIIVSSEGSRAKSLNAGAEKASREFLWFLHSDSQINKDVILELEKNIKQKPDSLHYFKLGFLDDGSPFCFLNSFGANVRSKLFGSPFGDQGFCINKKLFGKVDGYPEDVEYGEDHLFVWYAKQAGIKLNCLRAKLYTSARKYKEKGWIKLTFLYQYLWLKQAVPEIMKLLRGKRGAIAIFVKTPGLTPAKTRLAETIGREIAEEFYLLALDAVESVVRNLNIKKYWAIAEKEGADNPRWQNFETKFTGEGEFGQRLHNVYSELLQKNDFVILIGADSPQVTKNIIESAITKLQQNDFVMGRAEDGGFYLFGGKKEIENEIWNSVEYSRAGTADELMDKLDGKVGFIETLTDVDVEEDLKKLYEQLFSCDSKEQRKLKEWLATIVGDLSCAA